MEEIQRTAKRQNSSEKCNAAGFEMKEGAASQGIWEGGPGQLCLNCFLGLEGTCLPSYEGEHKYLQCVLGLSSLL